MGVYRNGVRLPFEPGDLPGTSFYEELDVDYTGIPGEMANRLHDLALRRVRKGESGRRHLEAMVQRFKG